MNHMPTLVRTIRNLFSHDIVYATFWMAVAITIFFFPVMLGWQSLAEAVPTFYSHTTPDPSVKTLWQVDGGFHTVDVIPLMRAEVGMIKAGIPPLWGAYSGGGEPLLVNNTVNVYYPLRLIFFFVGNSARAFDWYFLLRFLITGVGMFMYLRIIGLRRIVSLWGAIAYAFTGYLLLYLTYPFLDIESMLPWALWATERYFKDRSVRSSAFLGFFIAMIIMIGQPQSTIITTLFVALYFIWNAALHNKTKKEWCAVIGHALFVIGIAAAIASPFIIDFLVSYGQGKGIDDWQTKGLLTFSPMLLLHFIVTPAMMPEVAAAGHLFDRYQFIIPYVGMSVLMLFFVSLFLKKKPFPLVPLYVWIAFIVLKNAGFPLVQWIGTLPVLSQIGWYKAYGPLAAAIVICAAIAFEHILREYQDERRIWWRGFYTCIALIPAVFLAAYAFARNAFVAAYVPNFDFFNRRPEMIQKVMALIGHLPSRIQGFAVNIIEHNGAYAAVFLCAEAVIFSGVALVILFFLRHKRYARHATAALVLLTAFELWFSMPKIRDGFQYFDPYAHTPPYVQFLKDRMGNEGVSRTFSLGGVFRGHAGELYHIQKAQNNSSLKSKRYFLFLPEAIARRALTAELPASELAAVPEKFFDAFNIRYLISEEALDPKLGFQLAYDEDVKIYGNKRALPKAYVVFQKQSVSSPEEARNMFYAPWFDPHTAAIVEDGNAIALPPATSAAIEPRTIGTLGANGRAASPAAVIRYTSNEVILQTTSDRDGILVITDVFYPGWQAYLDGKKVTTYAANVMFRGIALPRGAHTVRFAYELAWFWPSLILSLITMLGVIVSLFSFTRKTMSS